MKKQLFAIVITGLLTLSAGAQAEWARLGSNSGGTGYLWYPVEQYYPFAYPLLGSTLSRPVPVTGWSHQAQSILSEMAVDCRDGRAKARRVTAYAGPELNGPRTRLKWLVSNGLKIVVGRWYAYSRFSPLARKAIRLSCE